MNILYAVKEVTDLGEEVIVLEEVDPKSAKKPTKSNLGFQDDPKPAKKPIKSNLGFQDDGSASSGTPTEAVKNRPANTPKRRGTRSDPEWTECYMECELDMRSPPKRSCIDALKPPAKSTGICKDAPEPPRDEPLVNALQPPVDAFQPPDVPPVDALLPPMDALQPLVDALEPPIEPPVENLVEPLVEPPVEPLESHVEALEPPAKFPKRCTVKRKSRNATSPHNSQRSRLPTTKNVPSQRSQDPSKEAPTGNEDEEDVYLSSMFEAIRCKASRKCVS